MPVTGSPRGVHLYEGGVHIRGEICPRSDPDIAHMEYSMEPLKFIIVYQGANDSGSLEFSHVKSS